MNSPAETILVTSLGRKAPQVAALRSAGALTEKPLRVLGADVDPGALARWVCDDFWHMPPLTALTPDALLAACRTHGVTAILPTRDGELPWFAHHAEHLRANGVAVMISPPTAIAVCQDKLAFAEHLIRLGAPAIPTATAPGAWPWLVVKERHGAGSRGLGLRLTPADALTHAAALAEPVFQPFCAGRELSIDAYVDGLGRCLGVVARRRALVVGGESQMTISEHHPRLETLCADLSVRLGLRGHVCWQAIEDPDHRLHLIECNPRVGGASTLSFAAGLHSLAWFLLEARGQSLSSLPFVRSPSELRQVRLPADVVLPA